jgi:hypothetical protein
MSFGLTAAARRTRAQDGEANAGAPPVPGSWHLAPEYLPLFVPRIYHDAYRAFTAEMNLDAAIRVIVDDPVTAETRSPGAWIAHSENPLDAFGSGGQYDRWQVARLYGSRRPAVARGPRGRQGIVEESWTLISPYPSADLRRLEPGTLLIILRVP